MTEPVTTVSLPEPVVRRILASLGAAGKQTPPQDQAASAEPPAVGPAASPAPPDTAKSPVPDPRISAEALDSAESPAPDPGASAEVPAPDRASPSGPAAPPHAVSPERPTPLPERVPGTSDAHRPPGRAVRPALRAALALFWSREAPPDPFPVVAEPRASAGTQQAATGEAAAEPAAHEPAATPQAPPRPASPPQRLQRRTRRRRTVTSAVIVVVALAGLLALMLNRHATAATGSGGQASAGEAAIRDQAAAWVASQVSRAATVACDPQMCQALEARGIPAAALLELRRGAADPLSAGVIIATPAVRGLLGRSYFGRCAPAAIAGFGSGNASISVRVIAPRGARSGC
jgi:hypothetical protein